VTSGRFHGQWHLKVFLVLLAGLLPLEYYGKVFERGIGHYLKWQNHKRPQLGRMWEHDRQSIVAQNKIQSIRSGIDDQQRSADSIQSLKELFENVVPAFPLVVTRQKFLQLYNDFPGQWSERIISPFELIEIDSGKKWDRVLLKRFGPWITVGFLNLEGLPIKESFLSVDALYEVQSTRTVKRGRLEDSGFTAERIYPIDRLLPVLKTLDLETQKTLFPDPRWFLEKDYHVTRLGIQNGGSGTVQSHTTLGIEYDTDYNTGVLLIPVPVEITYNILSLVENMEGENTLGENPSSMDPSGDTP